MRIPVLNREPLDVHHEAAQRGGSDRASPPALSRQLAHGSTDHLTTILGAEL